MSGLLFTLTFLAALGAGVVAGVFFAFSNFVMRALGGIAPAQGIAAMQSINVTVINAWFMTALFGTGVLCIILAIASFLTWQDSGVSYLLAGSLIYLVGTVLVTMVFNVPLNNSLAAVDPASAEGARLWQTYLADWTNWNHVRTVAALASSALFIVWLATRPPAA